MRTRILLTIAATIALIGSGFLATLALIAWSR
jgi:hypothetical protein